MVRNPKKEWKFVYKLVLLGREVLNWLQSIRDDHKNELYLAVGQSLIMLFCLKCYSDDETNYTHVVPIIQY